MAFIRTLKVRCFSWEKYVKQFSGICARRVTGYVKLQISNIYTEIKEYIFFLSDLLILNIYTKMKLRFFENSLNFFLENLEMRGKYCVCLQYIVRFSSKICTLKKKKESSYVNFSIFWK